MALHVPATALTYFKGDRSGPNNWGINTMAHATVVVASKPPSVCPSHR